MYTQLFPILTTPDLERALHFYRDLLGAAVTYSFPGPDGRPAYVGLELGASHLGLGQDVAAAGADRRAISLWVYTTDCDAAVARLRADGVPILEEPSDQPWGERIARVRDPDGNVVIVGAHPAGAPADAAG